jgi:excisionase family DNA binding protein
MPRQSSELKQKRFRSPRQVAERWGVSRSRVIQALKSGKLRAVRLGNRGHYMIPVAEVQRVERGE